jgi:hypothetical protein
LTEVRSHRHVIEARPQPQEQAARRRQTGVSRAISGVIFIALCEPREGRKWGRQPQLRASAGASKKSPRSEWFTEQPRLRMCNAGCRAAAIDLFTATACANDVRHIGCRVATAL